MLPVFARLFTSERIFQPPVAESSPSQPEPLDPTESQMEEIKKTAEFALGVDFINYIADRKINDSVDMETEEFKTILFDWFFTLKHKLDQKTPSKKETINLLNVFSLYITKIWQQPGYLSVKVKNAEDLKQALFLEGKFQESVSKAILNNNQSEIQRLLKKGLIFSEDGIFYTSMQAAPVLNILTYFLNIAGDLHRRFDNPDMKDLQFICDYYFDKIAPEFQRFNLKSPIQDYCKLFVLQFSGFVERKGLLHIYRKTIANLNATVTEIKFRKAAREFHEISEKNREKELAQLLKNHIAEQSLVSKEEFQNRKKIQAEYNLEFIHLSKLNSVYTSDVLLKGFCDSENMEFLKLISDSLLEAKKIHAITFLERSDKFFSKTLEKIKSLPKNLEFLTISEKQERKKVVSDAFSEAQLIEQLEKESLEVVKIKTLQRKRFQSLGNYFADKLKYSTMKELPSHIKIPLIENSEAKFRDFLKADHVRAFHKLLFEKEIDFFQQEEAAKRGELFVQSEFSPVKVHTPYGGSPLRLKVSEPNGQVNFLKA